MAHWVATSWGQIWPNLAANVLWVPLAAVHHLLMRRHVDRRHEQLKQHMTALTGAGTEV
jgi:hypothetical protein